MGYIIVIHIMIYMGSLFDCIIYNNACGFIWGFLFFTGGAAPRAAARAGGLVCARLPELPKRALDGAQADRGKPDGYMYRLVPAEKRRLEAVAN